LRRRAGGARCALGNGFAHARILAIVEASTGNRGRRVRPSLSILAHAKAAHTRRVADAGLREIQPEWSEFETATEAPCHSLPSLQRARRAALQFVPLTLSKVLTGHAAKA
jgi:hypothetical protein